MHEQIENHRNFAERSLVLLSFFIVIRRENIILDLLLIHQYRFHTTMLRFYGLRKNPHPKDYLELG